MRLLDYSSNVYSQSGEDGILEFVLSTIGNLNHWCVEFGAWDGEHLSNTRNLTKNHSFSGVLIEGNIERFKTLKERFESDPKLVLINQMVGITANDGLDKVLAPLNIPLDFDLLSIDIDGNDIHVWKNIIAYSPKVVCIEYNPTIDSSIYFVQPPDVRIRQGSSLLALDRLAKSKNYSLIAVTRLNAIFVRSELFGKFSILDNSLQKLREDNSWVTHIFTGYDGKVFLSGYGKILWHDIPYPHLIPQIPYIIRDFPDDFGVFRKVALKSYKLVKRILSKLRSMGAYVSSGS